MRSPKNVLIAMTALRICITYFLCYALYASLMALSTLLLGIALTTDLLDGALARKWRIETVLGSYLDVFSDFILVASVFYTFTLLKLYPLWIVFVFVGMFVQFLLSPDIKGKLRYDPIGKHYGTFLFIVMLLSTFHFERPFYSMTTVCIIIVSILTVISRYLPLILSSINGTMMRSRNL